MLAQKKSFFRFTSILPLVILLIFVFTLQKQGATAAQEGSREKAKMAEYEKGFNAHLDDLFNQLKTLFKKADFEGMADLLVDRAVLFTPSGEKITNKGELLNYFKSAKQPMVIDLRLTKVCSKVFMVAEPIDMGPETIDAIGHAIITYHLIEEVGENITNTTGSMVYSARHHSKCVWGN